MTPGGLEAVIWDFNGTIVDDVEHIVRAVNRLLARRDLPRLTVTSFRDVFGFPIVDYYHKIGFDLSAESMSDLSAEFHEAYMPGLSACSLQRGVVEILEKFRAMGLRQLVLSAMEESRLCSTIEGLGIARYFDGIYGIEHLEGDSKLSRGRDLLRNCDITAETALLIGDTDHDAEVADALGVSAVLVAQGHQSLERLRATGCAVFETLQQAAAMNDVVPW